MLFRKRNYVYKPAVGAAQVDHNHPLAQRLCGLWLANEGNNLALYDLAQAKGIYNIGYMANAEWVFDGEHAPGLRLRDDGDDYIYMLPRPGPATGFTLAVWVRLAQDGLYALGSQYDSINEQAYFQFVTIGGGYLYATIHEDFDVTTIGRLSDTGEVVADNRLYHLAFTWDGTPSCAGVCIYKNGVRVDLFDVANGTFTAPNPNPIDFYLMAQEGGISPPGTFYGAATWERGLSQAEIQELYVNPYGMLYRPRRSVPTPPPEVGPPLPPFNPTVAQLRADLIALSVFPHGPDVWFWSPNPAELIDITLLKTRTYNNNARAVVRLDHTNSLSGVVRRIKGVAHMHYARNKAGVFVFKKLESVNLKITYP